ncbi:greatwall-like domain-containing [Octopus vulgaris]|uniref:Greatwall-like domain-containing n=1 Tax=Octopus vulgaris TaxID=6645 RepID=A0AA36AY00_OCTVU|nr:greatwall-like domain-containing [Octopus vulgaris]
MIELIRCHVKSVIVSQGVKNMKIFENVAWEKLLEQPAPFQPQPSDETDTTYFEVLFCDIDTKEHCLGAQSSA